MLPIDTVNYKLLSLVPFFWSFLIFLFFLAFFQIPFSAKLEKSYCWEISAMSERNGSLNSWKNN